MKLSVVGLADSRKLTPQELSGGMKKRAAVARALALDPQILVFDEPSAGLDPIVAAELDELILALKKAFNMTVLVVTHEMASAFRIADRMAILAMSSMLTVSSEGIAAPGFESFLPATTCSVSRREPIAGNGPKTAPPYALKYSHPSGTPGYFGRPVRH